MAEVVTTSKDIKWLDTHRTGYITLQGFQIFFIFFKAKFYNK